MCAYAAENLQSTKFSGESNIKVFYGISVACIFIVKR